MWWIPPAIEVNRRRRWAKSDALDVRKLLGSALHVMLCCFYAIVALTTMVLESTHAAQRGVSSVWIVKI